MKQQYNQISCYLTTSCDFLKYLFYHGRSRLIRFLTDLRAARSATHIRPVLFLIHVIHRPTQTEEYISLNEEELFFSSFQFIQREIFSSLPAN